MTLPIEWIYLVVNRRLFRSAQVYLYLKSISDGKTCIQPELVNEITEVLGLKSGKTTKKAIEKLLELNWVGYNPASKYYFVRSFKNVAFLHGFSRKTVAKFEIEYLGELKAYLIGAIIEDLIRKQKRRIRKLKVDTNNSEREHLRAERYKGRSFQPEEATASFFPLANKALAKILHISVQTAFEYKKLAKEQGYIEIKKNFKHIDISHKELWLYKKTIDEAEAAKVRVLPLGNDRYIVYSQECDTVKSNVIFAYSKKIKSYIRVQKGKQPR